MATYTVYEQIGIKEDVSDIITNISPTKTPFQMDIGKEKVNNTIFQWQEDSLRAVAANAKVEGATAVDITADPTVLRQNRTQIMSETSIVSGTADVVSTYGRAKESAYQLAKSAAQVKRDLENALVGIAGTAYAVGSAGVARTMAGYQAQINTVATSNVTYCGAATALSEAFLLTNLQIVYNAGSDPSRISVTPANSTVVAAFAAATGRYRTVTNPGADQTKLVNTVDIYVSPFGEQKVVLNRFQRTANTLIYDPEMWTLCVLRPWTRESLAKVGDANRQMLVGEFSLKHKAFRASGIVVDNATTGF